jgi:hypothetical protein
MYPLRSVTRPRDRSTYPDDRSSVRRMVPRTEIASPDSHATGYAYFVDTLANTYPEKYLVVVVRTPAQTQTHLEIRTFSHRQSRFCWIWMQGAYQDEHYTGPPYS